MLIDKIKMTKSSNSIFTPTLLRITNKSDKEHFETLLNADRTVVHDEIYSQLQELIKCRNPQRKLTEKEYTQLIASHLNNTPISDYGVWAYYPWSYRLVHILDKQEFIELRTNRNKYKITNEEQELLTSKTIGIIGLSVGQSIALTIAMERICGNLRLADFDIAELSNLNRIRTGVHNIGTKKTILAAREILEIDPYINISIYNDGINESNINSFFTEGGKLDLLVEVCDGLDVKILSRFKARELNIPVVMDTNDKGMLDVERFDLEPARPILHGLAGDLDPQKIKDLTNEEKIPYILKMVGTDTLSVRLKASMMEVEQSITTWPQLASSVVLGGALVTDVVRRIFLDQYHDSGRYYIDLDELVKDKLEEKQVAETPESSRPDKLSDAELQQISGNYIQKQHGIKLLPDQVEQLVNAAIMAPSGGNAQPWKFLFHNNVLFVFHDEHYSYSLLDFNNLGSYIALGAAIENISIKAKAMHLEARTTYFPLDSEKKLVATIYFENDVAGDAIPGLEDSIYYRLTNRTVCAPQHIDNSCYEQLSISISGYEGAALHFVTEREQINELGDLLANAEMLRIIHERGHTDTFNEVRWTPEENTETRDGIDVATLGISNGEIAAFKIAKDEKAIAFLRKLHGGKAFKKMITKAVGGASAMGIISMPEYSELNFVKGGRALERIWLEANKMNISLQPIAPLVFLLARLKQGAGEGFDEYFKAEFEEIDADFYRLLPDLAQRQPVFIFRLCIADEPKVKSLRKNIDSVFVNA